MKYLIFLFFGFLFILSLPNFLQGQGLAEKYSFINPSGTYILKGEKRKDDIHGPFAEIRIKMLEHDQFAISAYFNDGYPDFETETFLDTLVYSYNSARYYREGDSCCSLYFYFKPDGIEITYVRKAKAHSCAFKEEAISTGFIPKAYSVEPVIMNLDRN